MARKGETITDLEPKPEFIQCAFETCGNSAVVKIQTRTGWAKLCMPHYMAHFNEQGRIAHEDAGLMRYPTESHPEHRKRVFACWREMSKRFNERTTSE